MFVGSVGPQDALYIPANFYFLERVLPSSDLLGVRVQILRPDDTDILDQINTSLIAKQKTPNEMLQSAVDFLTLWEPPAAPPSATQDLGLECVDDAEDMIHEQNARNSVS